MLDRYDAYGREKVSGLCLDLYHSKRYVAQHMGNDKYDVVHIGPYTVSKGLRLEEAVALAKALNEENKDR